MRDEFSGFYDGLNRLDYMAGLKEDLCNVYDGRPFRRERTKPATVASRKANEWRHEVREPFLSLAVATTEERFREVARAGEGGIARRAVMRTLRATKREMDELEATLRERGQLIVARVRVNGGESAVYRAVGG
ncbi:MAG: hypothetical protein HW416_1776 [Chloroflexi bacterium]|nr:hypothetical protein [Chloroflexota bacterium]